MLSIILTSWYYFLSL